MARGLSNKEIAERLGPKRPESHVGSDRRGRPNSFVNTKVEVGPLGAGP
ncbi:MAG: hypothetical protein M3046_12740 [Actinomycetota bacterium]|nr:hypothetical protein [Actinomycetota bacterium]